MAKHYCLVKYYHLSGDHANSQELESLPASHEDTCCHIRDGMILDQYYQ